MVKNLICPKCKSNRTAYLPNDTFICLDCKYNFTKSESLKEKKYGNSIYT